MLAFDYDKSKKDIALKISDFADKLGDQETANKYKTLGGRTEVPAIPGGGASK